MKERRKPVRVVRPVGRTASEARAGGRFAFFRETWSEYRKVVWPTRRDTVRLTGIVIALTITLGIILGGIDYGFARLVEFIGGAG